MVHSNSGNDDSDGDDGEGDSNDGGEQRTVFFFFWFVVCSWSLCWCGGEGGRWFDL